MCSLFSVCGILAKCPGMSDDILGISEDIRNQRTNKQCASQNRVYGQVEDTQTKRKEKRKEKKRAKAKKHAGRHACTQTDYTQKRSNGQEDMHTDIIHMDRHAETGNTIAQTRRTAVTQSWKKQLALLHTLRIWKRLQSSGRSLPLTFLYCVWMLPPSFFDSAALSAAIHSCRRENKATMTFLYH